MSFFGCGSYLADALETSTGLDVVEDLTKAILPLTKVSYSMYRNY